MDASSWSTTTSGREIKRSEDGLNFSRYRSQSSLTGTLWRGLESSWNSLDESDHQHQTSGKCHAFILSGIGSWAQEPIRKKPAPVAKLSAGLDSHRPTTVLEARDHTPLPSKHFQDELELDILFEANNSEEEANVRLAANDRAAPSKDINCARQARQTRSSSLGNLQRSSTSTPALPIRGRSALSVNEEHRNAVPWPSRQPVQKRTRRVRNKSNKIRVYATYPSRGIKNATRASNLRQDSLINIEEDPMSDDAPTATLTITEVELAGLPLITACNKDFAAVSHKLAERGEQQHRSFESTPQSPHNTIDAGPSNLSDFLTNGHSEHRLPSPPITALPTFNELPRSLAIAQASPNPATDVRISSGPFSRNTRRLIERLWPRVTCRLLWTVRVVVAVVSLACSIIYIRLTHDVSGGFGMGCFVVGLTTMVLPSRRPGHPKRCRCTETFEADD